LEEANKVQRDIEKASKEAALGLKEKAQGVSFEAMLMTQIGLELFGRFEEEKERHIQKTQKEVDASKHQLAEKVQKYEQGLGDLGIAQEKSKVQQKEESLQKLQTELCTVREDKKRAQEQYETFKKLERVGYYFDRELISSTAPAEVRKAAGTFKIIQVPKETLVTNGESSTGSQCTTLQILPAEIEKLLQAKIEAKVEEKLAIQADYHRIEKEEMQVQLEEMKSKLEQLTTEQRSEASCTSWTRVGERSP